MVGGVGGKTDIARARAIVDLGSMTADLNRLQPATAALEGARLSVVRAAGLMIGEEGAGGVVSAELGAGSVWIGAAFRHAHGHVGQVTEGHVDAGLARGRAVRAARSQGDDEQGLDQQDKWSQVSNDSSARPRSHLILSWLRHLGRSLG